MELQKSFQGELSEIRSVFRSEKVGTAPDLKKMAADALGYLSRNPLPEHGWECRFSFAPSALPPFCPDPGQAEASGLVDPITVGDTESRNDVAFSMMRRMCGDWETGREAEEQVHRRLTGYVKKQGFGRGLVWCRGYAMGIQDHKPYASIWATAMLLHSECLRCRDGRGNAELARELFEGLAQACVRENGRAFYPHGASMFDEKTSGGYEGHYPAVMSGLCEYMLLTGDERCRALMTELAEGFLQDLQPKNLHRPDGGLDGHNHVQMHAVRGMAQFAWISGEPRYLRWVREIDNYYRKWALDTGWLPEIRDLEDHSSHSETCLNADMLETELWLALAGYDELWDCVDRSLRNYFFKMQFRLTDRLVQRYSEWHPEAPADEKAAALALLKELEGGFISAATPNDRVFEVRPGGQHFGSVPVGGKNLVFDMMGCCPPSGMRAIYKVWEYAQVTRERTTTVYLPIDSDSAFASVRSELPACGHLTVTSLRGGTLLIRVPLWALREQVTVRRNGAGIPPVWSGTAQQYIRVDGLLPGDRAEIAYPLPEFDQTVQVTPFRQKTGTYRYHWVGNTVAEVLPQGEYLPLYGKESFAE